MRIILLALVLAACGPTESTTQPECTDAECLPLGTLCLAVNGHETCTQDARAYRVANGWTLFDSEPGCDTGGTAVGAGGVRFSSGGCTFEWVFTAHNAAKVTESADAVAVMATDGNSSFGVRCTDRQTCRNVSVAVRAHAAF